MNENCPAAGRLRDSRRGRRIAGFLVVTLLLLQGFLPVNAADVFPFDRELLLDAAPMPPAKRMPMLTVAEDGSATLNLWCRSVAARVQFSDGAIRIETAPLPEALPQYMSEGQCNEVRVQADADLLAALNQVTAWRIKDDGVVLEGPAGSTPMEFRASSH